MLLAIGMRLGPYEIVAPLGSGGMGEVYRARDTRLARTVAIKLLTGPVDHDARARLLDEARAAAALNHPNICTIHEIADADSRLFIVMEHVDGRLLSEVAAEGAPIETTIRYGIQIADALTHAHDRGIVHRDLKTANLMLTSDGRLKVLDFGIAQRFTDPAIDLATQLPTLALGLAAGTLAYLAPEVLRGGIADRRADIWAIGVVLYELLAGHRPFEGASTFDLSSAILRDTPAPLPGRVPRALRTLVARCLEKDPAQRYQRAGEVQAALEMIAAGPAPGTSAGRSRAPRAPRATTAPAVGKSGIRAIAVLPLDNLSRDPEQEYFADGMTEALITDLAQIPALRVISRTSVMRFKGTTKPMAEIAGDLGVDGIVTGSVLRAGDRVRISAQLVHAPTDAHVWAHSYERQLVEVLSLQRDVASAIANEIRATTSAAPAAAASASTRRVDPETYAEYLKGRHRWHRLTEADVRKAMEHFHAALTRDPAYAPAYAGLALCHVGLSWMGAVVPSQASPRAKTAAIRALELDDSLWEPRIALGYVANTYDFDWTAAERELKTAVARQPGASDVHLFYSFYFTARGRFDEAEAALTRAHELDPLSALVMSNLGYAAFFARRYDKAKDYCRQALDLDPSHLGGRWIAGIALAAQKQYAQAIAELDEVRRVWSGVPILGWLGYACACAGQLDRARELLATLAAMPPDRVARSYEIARIHVGLGEVDAALTGIEQACDAHETEVAGHLAVDPSMDPLRSEGRFKAVLRRVGL